MKIGYIKIAKKKNKNYKDKFRNMLILVKCIFNIVEKDKFRENIFTVYNFNEKSIVKLIKKLKKEEFECAIAEQNYRIPYKDIYTSFSMRSMIPEIVEYCYKLVKPIIDEIYICTDIYNKENVEIIKSLIKKVKTVNVVTNNKKYNFWERALEEEGVFITVSNNKRKCLKNASIVVNLDFNDFDSYNINREMVVIDTTGNIRMRNGFNGIIIRKVKLNTKKVLRVFGELENFDRSRLIDGELAKIGDYMRMREFIRFNKIYIDSFYNYYLIRVEEFERIRKVNKSKLSSRKAYTK